MDNQYYISLGAGPNQVGLIVAARKLGYKIIGVDRNESAPGLALSDIRIVESIRNYRKILYKINTMWFDGDIIGGYSASYGEALLSWSYLAEKFRLHGLSRPLTEVLLDKYEVRKRLNRVASEKLAFRQPVYFTPGPKFKPTRRFSMNFPAIVKPRNGAGKSGILEASDRSQAAVLISRLIKDRGTGNSPIVEEKIEGDEITVCGLVQDFQFFLVSISDKITSGYAPFIELEHRFPSRHYEYEERLRIAHQQIVEILQISDSPVVSEWKIRDGELFLIEISMQIPGEFLGSFLIPEAVGYDYFLNLARLTSGKKIDQKIDLAMMRTGKIVYYPSKLESHTESELRKGASFFQVLNPDPSSPPRSNHDRYGVAGYIY